MRLKRNWRHNLGLLAVVVAVALVLGDYGRDFIAVDLSFPKIRTI